MVAEVALGDKVVPSHEVIQLPSSGVEGQLELYKQCIGIRIRVFCDEQGYPIELEEDEYDANATHFLLRLTPNLSPIGTIRCLRLHDPELATSVYKLSRLAVLSDYRKYGFGRALVSALNAWALADAKGKSLRIVAHAQVYAVPFYERFGYVAEGEIFDEDGGPHKKMVLKINDER